MLNMVRTRLRGLWNRRYFLWSRLVRPDVPVHPLSWVPDGFAIFPVSGTSVCVIENFCTPAEADALAAGDADSLAAVTYRSQLLTGLSAEHLLSAQLLGSDQHAGQSANYLYQSGRRSVADHVVQICLTAGTEALQIKLPGQRLTVTEISGRAVSWQTANGATCTAEQAATMQQVLRLEFAKQPGVAPFAAAQPRQYKTGAALVGDEALPNGVWAPGQSHLETVFGKPDQITDLVRKG